MTVKVPQRIIHKVVDVGGDTAAAFLTIGVLSDLLPTILAGFGIVWFGLRFVNFIRVNCLNKDPWIMGG